MRKYVFMVILITALIVFSFSTLSAPNTNKVNIGFNISEENQKREVISSDGKLRWNKTFGGSNDDYLRSLIQTDDGGYMITGETSSYSVGKADIWIIKLVVRFLNIFIFCSVIARSKATKQSLDL